jgi:hypothetical protein
MNLLAWLSFPALRTGKDSHIARLRQAPVGV